MARRLAFSRTIRSRRSSPSPRSRRSRNAEATAAEMSSSSVGRMRGPRWKSCTREPKALKTEATCAPGAAADHQHRRRHRGQPQASLCVLVNSNPGTSSRRLIPPVQRMNFPPAAAARSWFRSCADRRTARRRRVRTPTQRIDLLAPCRTGTHIVGNLADPREQPRVIQHRLIDRDAVLPELPSLSHQPGRMGQRPDGDRPIVCHAAKGVPSNERGACAEVRGAQRSDNPCRSSVPDSTSIIYRYLPVQRDSEAPSGAERKTPALTVTLACYGLPRSTKYS